MQKTRRGKNGGVARAPPPSGRDPSRDERTKPSERLGIVTRFRRRLARGSLPTRDIGKSVILMVVDF